MNLSTESLDEWASYLRDTISASSAIRERVPYVQGLLTEGQTIGALSQRVEKQDAKPGSPAAAAPASASAQNKESEEFTEWLKLMYQSGPKNCEPTELIAAGWWMQPLVVPLCRALAQWAANGVFPYVLDEDLRPPTLKESDDYVKAKDSLAAMMPHLAELLKSSHLHLLPQHQLQLMEKMLPPMDQLPKQVEELGASEQGAKDSLLEAAAALTDPILSGGWEMAAVVALAGSTSASALEFSAPPPDEELFPGDSDGSSTLGVFGGGFAGGFSAAGLREMVLRPSESGSASPSSLDTSQLSIQDGSGSSYNLDSPPALAKSVRSRIGRLDISSDAPGSASGDALPSPGSPLIRSSLPTSTTKADAAADAQPSDSVEVESSDTTSNDDHALRPAASVLMSEATLAPPESRGDDLVSRASFIPRDFAECNSVTDFEGSSTSATDGVKGFNTVSEPALTLVPPASGCGDSPTATRPAMDPFSQGPSAFLSQAGGGMCSSAHPGPADVGNSQGAFAPNFFHPAPTSQELTPVEELLIKVLQDPVNVLLLLGFRVTSNTDFHPDQIPTLTQCLRAFTAVNVPRSRLTVGAEDLAKHANWSAESIFWEPATGPQCLKNALAIRVLAKVVSGTTWRTFHSLPQGGAILEIRIPQGYGASWEVHTDRSVSFSGFLEPC